MLQENIITRKIKNRAPGSAVVGLLTLAAMMVLAFFGAPYFSRAADPSPGSLIKLTCPWFSSATHPCRAVYFYGSDGRRHAFPNEKTYFTWYADFSGVRTVSATFLASIPLGSNVTYRPGTRLIKIQTDPKVYAVALGGTLRWLQSEEVATALYGQAWNRSIDDISDAFYTNYRTGLAISVAAEFDPSAERAFATTIDDDLPNTRRSMTVTTAAGSFSIELIKLQQHRHDMVTDTADGRRCDDGCTAKPLLEYVQAANADIAINGAYFCPAEYPECAGKTNTFLAPFYDSDGRVMVNQQSMAVHEGPMLTYSSNGSYRYFRRTKDVGNTDLVAAASNYPSLIEDGLVVQGEPRLDQDMRIVKSVRGGIGIDERFVYLVIARNATVPDLAEILRQIGATSAMNLDGGGSAALWYGGRYVFGPGRALPNAILFLER